MLTPRNGFEVTLELETAEVYNSSPPEEKAIFDDYAVSVGRGIVADLNAQHEEVVHQTALTSLAIGAVIGVAATSLISANHDKIVSAAGRTRDHVKTTFENVKSNSKQKLNKLKK